MDACFQMEVNCGVHGNKSLTSVVNKKIFSILAVYYNKLIFVAVGLNLSRQINNCRWNAVF